jgi:dihydroorotate dehydrogenase electron transfer subunit
MKQIKDFTVTDIRQLDFGDFWLSVSTDEDLEKVEAGQFVNILIPNAQKTLLRRPISICDVDYMSNTLHFYIRKVGDGTKTLSELKTGDTLNIVYPLGNSFNWQRARKPLLIGGGCGIAPLFLLAKTFATNRIKPTVLLAGQTKNALSWTGIFISIANVHCITEDGTMGEKGLATQHSILNKIKKFDHIYTCGPEAMMQEVAEIAAQNSKTCQVSLERTMACGIGACLCCVTETKDGNRCVCTDGPIFDYKKLVNFIK